MEQVRISVQMANAEDPNNGRCGQTWGPAGDGRTLVMFDGDDTATECADADLKHL